MKTKRYILAMDEGTSSARSVLFDTVKNEIVAIEQKSFKQIYPKDAWVEHNPNDIWEAQQSTLLAVAAKVQPEEIFGIGITNQRETVVLWNKKTGKPVYNAIVWQCRRTADYCSKLQKDKELVKKIQKKTGLVIDPYFSATKIKWILENVPLAKKTLAEGNLLAGTIDTFLVWKLTKGKSFVTDTSNASRTMLFNINTLDWDDELLKLFNIPRCILPKVVSSSQVVGHTDILGYPLPIAGIAGDQQASLFGQACFNEGSIKNTYGTGCFMLMNIGFKPKFSSNKLLTTVAWTIGGKTTYALEGSVFNAGTCLTWLRDEVQLISNTKEINTLSEKVPDTDGVYFVPAFTGLGAPWWNSDARGMFTGLTRNTNKNHLVRAVLEGVAYSALDVFELIKKETKLKINMLVVDGGMCHNPAVMQFQADVLNAKIKVAKIMETTVLGAAYLAGLATGAYKSVLEIAKKVKHSTVYSPKMTEAKRKKLYEGWKDAVRRCL